MKSSDDTKKNSAAWNKSVIVKRLKVRNSSTSLRTKKERENSTDMALTKKVSTDLDWTRMA